MVKVKEASSKDSYSISLLINKLFKEIDHIMPDFTEDHINDLCKNLLNDNKTIIFIAINDLNECIGVITVVESTGFYTKGSYGVINELYVLPEYRSKGTGKILIEEVKKRSIEKKWNRLEVTTPDRVHWERTVKFYEKEGFIEIGPRLKFELK